MAPPLSKNQVRKLGERLRASERPASADLELLFGLLESYQSAMDQVADDLLCRTELPVSRRLKTTGTIVDKLKRNRSSHLGNMQDLAGVRIVLPTFERSAQDAICDKIVEGYATTSRSPKVTDRRAEPMHGYRAVHVVVFAEDVPVEVQLRTSLQHEWAEIFEKMADVYGRGIRYGEPPTMPPISPDDDQLLANIHTAERRVRLVTIKFADSLADGIDLVEAVWASGRERKGVEELLARTRSALADLGRELDRYTPIGRQNEEATQ